MVESLFRGRVTSDRRADDRIGIFQPAHIAVLSPQAVGDALTRAAERDITEGPVFVGADGPDSLHRLTAEVHLGHAETDMTPEALGELNQVLDAAGVGYTSEIYPGTIHGFTMSDTDAFNPAALQRHWDRLLPLLGRTLKQTAL